MDSIPPPRPRDVTDLGETSARHPRSPHEMTDGLGPDLIEVETIAIDAVDRQGVITAAFESFHAELYNFLRRSTRDAETAEDLLQDTFLRLTREIEAGRTPVHLRGWLYRVAANLAISRGRRHTTALRWLQRQDRASLSGVVDSPEHHALGREWTSTVEAALGTLPPDGRTALLLSAEGFTGEEIAAAIGRTHAATRALLTRTRVRVRLELERREAER